MKQKVFIAFLLVEAVLCMLLYNAQEKFSKVFSSVLAFPFEQIGYILRALSLSGAIGNGVAIVIYILISLSPSLFFYYSYKKRKLFPEDGLLLIVSALLFAVLYLMINPSMMDTYFLGSPDHLVDKALIGGILYSVLCGYGVLRILRLLFVADVSKLQQYLIRLLYLLNVIFVYIIFGASFGRFLDSVNKLELGNTGVQGDLGLSYVFLAIQYVVDVLPYLLNVLIVFAAIALLKELGSDRYSEITATKAQKLSRLCGTSLIITVLSNIAFNLLQFAFAKSLRVINGSIQIPLFSITFVLAALLLAQFIKENKQLKDDNDMFI
ncbi:hypothetical protein ACPWSR_04790 [Alloiococcus sp. CFN-8]|uniref:hypothetical protein n=1 Tax=Alloiococcus sp. CFN-8 TaxID=3416081 RepID=UPI003CF32E73